MRKLSVLIGDSTYNMAPFLPGLMQRVIGGGYDLTTHESERACKITELAETNEIDLFILFVNNIQFPDGNMPPKNRIHQTIELVRELKGRSNNPIIAISTFSEYAEQSLRAGANHFLKSPFRLEELESAVMDCLP